MPSTILSLATTITPDMSPAPAVEWNAEIFTGPLFGPTGRPLAGRVGVFTRDGQFLGDYSSADKILANGELAASLESALNEMGLEFVRTVKVLADGAECVITYTLPAITVKTPDGKSVAFRLDVENSYNGRRKIAAAISAFRLICFNGMRGLMKTFSLSRRHSALVDVAGLVQTLTPEIENGAIGLGQLFGRMPEIALPGDGARHFFRNLAKRKPLSARVCRTMESVWAAGPVGVDGDAKGTLWGVYNAGTQVLSNREREGFAVADVQAGFWGEVAATVAGQDEHSRKMLAQLLVPVTATEAYGDEAHLLS